MFYEKVEEDPDFDKFTRYYKWIDSSISTMVSQLFPISARNSQQISDIVESHIFERSKYQNKFPTVKTFTAESKLKVARRFVIIGKSGMRLLVAMKMKIALGKN